MMVERPYDVAIIGGGPVGCTAALAFADRGARVLVLEANSRASARFAGEWLHPPALEVLRSVRIDLAKTVQYPTGLGFAVFPEDASPPILLPYPGANTGLSLPHAHLVATLRATVGRNAIEYIDGARVTNVDEQTIEYRLGDSTAHARATRIVGASGRTGVSRRLLDVRVSATTCSRMAGVVLKERATLPFEGYGHVFLGAPGPILAYRISPHDIRLCLDVPVSLSTKRDAPATLYEAYAPALPEGLREPLRRALLEREIEWATNQMSARRSFGTPDFALVGDAVGHFHPLTAAGLTVGFQDALELARSHTFDRYRRRRTAGGRVPEMLATALYDVFSGTSDEAVEMRRAVYSLWRKSETERRRTMHLLSCAAGRADFGVALLKVVGIAAGNLLSRSVGAGERLHAWQVGRGIGSAVRGWITGGAASPRRPEPPHPGGVREPLHGVQKEIDPRRQDGGFPRAARPRQDRPETLDALELGARALIALQDEDGSWEGECIWSALLAAEYVLAWHVMGRTIPETRKQRILLHFQRARLPDGLWGLSQIGKPSLFVTTLVYVATRFLGLPVDHGLLGPARSFFASEGGVEAIPTWGKFWLALVSLYRWEGMNPVIPELWAMPRAIPIHPSRYYCHTRLIYVAMATLHAERLHAPVTGLTEALRSELFPQGFGNVDFPAARNELRQDDLWKPPHPVLRHGYSALRVFDRSRSRNRRADLLAELRALIRWELRVTHHTAISPVSGLLDILALWAEDSHDPDVARAIERFECWIWEDDQEGMRVAGARSAIWDTGFAVQALRAAAPHVPVREAALRGARFLESQQIRASFPGYAKNFRSDPSGGYPFSWVWHGWPVSDCTAEAILCRLETPGDEPSDEDVALAAAFILRSQGADGGFGSYEAKRVPFSIEWLNPAEMFGDSMAEAGYVECTASCITALAKIAVNRPHLLKRAALERVPEAIRAGALSIRRQQLPTGAWPGAWGVRFLYGTWFGVRGLLAAGASPTDPAVRKACAWVKARQRPDGGWGERLEPHSTEYVEHEKGQIVQTAWALLTLSEASDPDFGALERAARFLGSVQLGNGQWPRQDPTGLFFRTAQLEYNLYRSYFPVWALAAFETRRAARARLFAPAQTALEAGL
jgi:lanosterol synthase